ncbi:BatD family protein [Thalassotalea sp. PS06]|uniref:BatD family protein n=1 Tax=Thalassotalea sp. PS06 TaxID=2594005 RepID=UPI0011633026|nr:BatD family protein [Thalassotalea sp. PS06]QDP01781.1 protein BatD [Thalassotalea sp. PS06]
MVKRLLTLSLSLLTLVCHSSWALDSLTASIDKNPATVNESLVLTVIANDSMDASAFDPSPLDKDFIVGRTSVSSQTSMVNFKTTRMTRWTTVLVPQKPGKYTIPAFTIEGASSKPIEVEILAANDSRAKKNQDVFISTKVSDTRVYVQQQFTLKVKLHLAQELKTGSLTEPQMTGAEIKQIGDDKESMEIINGIRYRTIERSYSVKPNTSGDFTLHTPIFAGEIISGQRRALFSNFDQGKPVRVEGKDIDIEVKAKPAEFVGDDWLPSEILTIEDEWPQLDSFPLGEPITRRVTITAAALSEEQLPQINFKTPDGIKIYPDQQQSQSNVQAGLLISQKVQDFAIVPSKPGIYTIPEVQIPWWNTKTNRVEYASLPQRTFSIEGAVATPMTESQDNLPATPVVIEKSSNLQWLFLAGWILTSLAWLATSLYQRGFLKQLSRNPKSVFNSAASTSYLQLLAACKKNDGQLVLTLLPQWAAQTNNEPSISSLSQVIDSFNDDELERLISELQACYFGNQNTSWDGKALYQKLMSLNSKQPEVKVQMQMNP